MVAQAGAGPDPIPHKQLTADKLANAINFCLRDESLDRAKELASKIAAERGSDVGAQLLHQYLEVDRLRCTLAPSRTTVWRIRRTQVKLSAFAACTLANANLLDFHDLKLFRPQEYYTDEGPWDPVSGGFTACCRAFSGMAMGLADFPSETLKTLQLPFKSNRQQSRTSVPTVAEKCEIPHPGKRSDLRLSLAQSHTSAGGSEALIRNRSPPNLDNACQRPSYSRNSSSSQDHDMLRQTGAHTSKGLGRIIRTAVRAPMDISVSMTKGFHNLPKLWGDDTVRPQERVSDFKSGIKAVGKEFGYGWYDGVTGLITQPWTGAQKEGAGGFLKGFGKGIGGFATKPNAALLSVLGYTMKGVHKEVQKLFGSNVQTYIITSRTAQGYEEWLQSSDAEKEDVIARWKLIQKYLKKNRGLDTIMQDILDAQQRRNSEDAEAPQSYGRTTTFAQSANSVDAPTHDPETAVLTMGGSRSPSRLVATVPTASLGAAEISGNIRLRVQDMSRADDNENLVVGAIQDNMSQLQRQQQEAAVCYADQESLRQAMASSEAEAQRYAGEAVVYEKQLKLAMTQSLSEQKLRANDDEWESDIGTHNDRDEDCKRAEDGPQKMAAKAAVAVGGLSSFHPPAAYDQGHLEDTTQCEFNAQQQGQQMEKSPQAKTEEEIVIDYVKKQSLMEVRYQNKGKGRATTIDYKDTGDL
jgi:hypothetical protein